VDIYRFTCINSADLFGIAEGEGEGVDMDADMDMDVQRGGSSPATVSYHASSLTRSHEIITRPFLLQEGLIRRGTCKLSSLSLLQGQGAIRYIDILRLHGICIRPPFR
jgi:hypothetical protein